MTTQPQGFWESGDLISLVRMLLLTTQRGPASDFPDVAGIRGYDPDTGVQWYKYEDTDGNIQTESISIPSNPAANIPGLRSLYNPTSPPNPDLSDDEKSRRAASGNHGHTAAQLNIATDAAPGTGSLRTLGTGARQAAAGDHTLHFFPAYTRVEVSTSGVWTKPSNLDPNVPVYIILIGGGGGGDTGLAHNNSLTTGVPGGGGGGCGVIAVAPNDFDSIRSVVGAGGTGAGTHGGNTTVSIVKDSTTRELWLAEGGQGGDSAGANERTEGGAPHGGMGGVGGNFGATDSHYDGEAGALGCGGGGGSGIRVGHGASAEAGSGGVGGSLLGLGFLTNLPSGGNGGNGGASRGADGSNGQTPGGGGGAGASNGTNLAAASGGSGGSGRVYIYYVAT